MRNCRITIFKVIILTFLACLPSNLSAASQQPLNIQDQEKTSIADVLLETITGKNVQVAIEQYRELRATATDEYNFEENELNNLGYRLLGRNRVDDAIEIFKLNIEMFPEAWNPHDSLAEAYMVKAFSPDGDMSYKEQSIKHYKISLQMNPGNNNGLLMLNRIQIMENYTKHEYMIPMRDGIKLFTQVYTPNEKSAKYPIILLRTPYRVSPLGTEKLSYRQVLGPSQAFDKDGYIFVFQDVRGKYMSEGEFMQMRPLEPEDGGIDESTDTYDTIEWLLHNIQDNNGRVGMWGISYPGVYAAMALVNAHPALVAVSPQAPPADWFMGDDWHHNGAFFWFQAVNWMRSAGVYRPEPIDHFMDRLFTYPTPYLYDFFLDTGPVSNINARYFNDRVPFWNHMMEHGTYDDFWKARCTLPHFKNIRSAVITVGGWFDAENLYGALKTYASIEEHNPGIRNTIVMGPWYHGGWAFSNSDLLGDINVLSKTAGQYYREDIELPFFNYHLKGKGEFSPPEALVFETGTNIWRSYNKWPPTDVVKQNLYLRSGESLSFSPPTISGEDTYDEYVSDPNKPVPHSPRMIARWSYDFMHDDQRFASRRPDVLVFETEPLEKNITIAGPIIAELYVSTTGTDADWVVKLIDVYPEDAPRNAEGTWMGGYQMLVRGDVIRGKFRNSFEKPEPFKPGEVTKVRFELQDANHTFLRGHMIMVQVQSTWFPLMDRNPQKFVDIYSATEDDFQTAVHRVYHSQKYPSHLKVEVVQHAKQD